MKIITRGCGFSKQSFLGELVLTLKVNTRIKMSRSMSTYDGSCIGAGSEGSY